MFARAVHEARHGGLGIPGAIFEKSHTCQRFALSPPHYHRAAMTKRKLENWLGHRGVVTRSVAGLKTVRNSIYRNVVQEFFLLEIG